MHGEVELAAPQGIFERGDERAVAELPDRTGGLVARRAHDDELGDRREQRRDETRLGECQSASARSDPDRAHGSSSLNSARAAFARWGAPRRARVGARMSALVNDRASALTMATTVLRESPLRKAPGDVFGASRDLTEVFRPAPRFSACASPRPSAPVSLSLQKD